MTGTETPGDRVVLVELFTSEGCSSCPPADRLLRELVHDPVLSPRIVALSYHVDYWNSLGWNDPFSSRRWSERQERYARAIGSELYTPQIVVDGRQAMVGSRERDVRHAILEATRRPGSASIEIEAVSIDRDTMTVDVSTNAASGDVWVVVWESGLSTAVPRGENRGRTLAHDRVVRDMRLVAMDGHVRRGRASIELGAGWKRDALGVAAFLQDAKTSEVVGAIAR